MTWRWWERVSHDVGVMYLGRLVEIGPRASVFENPSHPYTQALLKAVPVADPSKRLLEKDLNFKPIASPVHPIDYEPEPSEYRDVAPGHRGSSHRLAGTEMTAMSARALLEKLVSFPTVSRDSNLALVDWVEGYLGDLGVTCHRDYDETGQKASLFAHIGPEVEGGVVLSGHTDVVPVDGQDWSFDPFAVTEKDGRLYGRGTCDMKGFDALALSAVAPALERGLTRPLQICLTRDEEIGCIGAPPMIRAMTGVVPKAELAIIGEPTGMQIVTGHKGGVGYDVHVRGFEVHSSLQHMGVSAVMEGARLIRLGQPDERRKPCGGGTRTMAMCRPGQRCMWA